MLGLKPSADSTQRDAGRAKTAPFSSPLRHRADVDGLRALAVVPVILFHAGLATFGGGYVGVDVFFVISGFVIALSLKRDLEAGRFSISGFYERRARRILPALTLVFAGTFLAALFLAPPVYFNPFAESLTAASTFLSNWYFWKNTGYFVLDRFHPLRHTWSLAVEEQYYLIAPLLMAFVFQFAGRRWRLILGSLLLASFALSVFATSADPQANFFSLPTRAWEILLGALLAMAPPPQISSAPGRQILGWLGVGLIAGPILLYTDATPFPGAAAALPCLGAALLIHLGAAPKPGFITQVLSSRPFVAIGLISYSLYLVHWPLIVITSFWLGRELEGGDIAFVIAASFALAGLSYVFVEQPLRQIRASRRLVLSAALICILASAAAGVVGPKINKRLHHQLVETYPGATSTSYNDLFTAWRDHTCMFNAQDKADIARWTPDACAFTRGSAGDILLWGDSYAGHYASGLAQESARFDGRVLLYGARSCPASFADGKCADFNRGILALIDQNHIRRVVIAGRYGGDPRIAGQIAAPLAALKARGVETVVIGVSPIFFMDPYLVGIRGRLSLPEESRLAPLPRVARINAELAARAREAGARFIDPTPAFCKDGQCLYRLNGHELFLDSGHFSADGSAYAVRSYFPYAKAGGARP